MLAHSGAVASRPSRVLAPSPHRKRQAASAGPRDSSAEALAEGGLPHTRGFAPGVTEKTHAPAGLGPFSLVACGKARLRKSARSPRPSTDLDQRPGHSTDPRPAVSAALRRQGTPGQAEV